MEQPEVKAYKTMVTYNRPGDGLLMVRHRSVNATSSQRAIQLLKEQLEQHYGQTLRYPFYGSKAELWYGNDA